MAPGDSTVPSASTSTRTRLRCRTALVNNTTRITSTSSAVIVVTKQSCGLRTTGNKDNGLAQHSARQSSESIRLSDAHHRSIRGHRIPVRCPSLGARREGWNRNRPGHQRALLHRPDVSGIGEEVWLINSIWNSMRQWLSWTRRPRSSSCCARSCKRIAGSLAAWTGQSCKS